ncbi:MAG: site-2 protease family protein [Oscillospiraceae bacterium]|nr:site-2 protease family protein [Oscillospiraceae bacterium]
MFSFNLSPETILMYLVRLMVIFLVNPLHESAHAFAAYKLGDDTAKNEGRLSLNPLVHIDPVGSLLLLFFGFGWAKPVPVNPNNFKKKRRDMMLTAVAGPLSNLIAALLGMIALQMTGAFREMPWLSVWSFRFADTAVSGSSIGYLYWMLYCFVDINITLCLFNMIPVPPLDGSRVLTWILPSKAAFWVIKNTRIFYGILMLLMFTRILNIPLYYGVWYAARGLIWLVHFLPEVM